MKQHIALIMQYQFGSLFRSNHHGDIVLTSLEVSG
uniref:Uncharacterized protein n=1 Tax=Arundo donax TaxID=35708 RepID=A0A0A9HJN4_ARUDO